MISEEFFKPTVIFFGLINSLATFQTMMNEILQDLINTGEVIRFIDNVIVRIKPRSFYKFTLISFYTEFTHSAYFQANSTDFYLLV